MSYIKKRFQVSLDRFGQAFTLKTRNTATGKPTLVGSGTGGSIPAGTYYYRVNPRFSGDEKALPGLESITTVGATSSVTVSGYTISGATDYKIYRSTDPSFPTPSLITTTAAASFVDTLATPSAGAPLDPSGDPYVFFTAGTIKAYSLSFVSLREMDEIQQFGLPAGINIEDNRILVADPATTVKPLDRIVFDGLTWDVQGIHSIYDKITKAMNMILLRRRTDQT